MGRNRISDSEKRMRGTDQPCRRSHDEILSQEINLKKLPPPPAWMTDPAKKFYRKNGKLLVEKGILNALSTATYCIYCQQLMDYVKLSEDLKEEGPVSEITIQTAKSTIQKPVANPKVILQQNALKQTLSIAKEFGFTPVSQLRLAFSLKKANVDDDYERYKKKK